MLYRNLSLIVATQLFVLCLSVSIGIAGPFGTEMGDKPDKYSNLILVKANNKEQIFKTQSLPKNHSYIITYELTFRESGLSKIVGASSQYSDETCNETLKIYNILKAQLSSKYHAPDEINEDVDSKWRVYGDNYFCYTLNINKRHHICMWNKNLPDNIQRIILGIDAINKNTSQVLISFEYKNINEEFKVNDNPSDADAL